MSTDMADDWEALADEPVAIPTLGGVKDSWEDEEDEALKELEREKELKEKLKEMPKPIKEDKPKAAPKKAPKSAPVEQHRDLTPEEKAARLEAEKKSDYENARDLFDGLDDPKAQAKERFVLTDKSFDDFKPKSERDFEEFANFLAQKITPFQREFSYRSFVRSLLAKITEDLAPEDVKDISKSLDTIINEKIKKQSGKKKKTVAKTVARAIGSDDEEDDDEGPVGGDEYDGFM